jgi:type I site-specific restriction-modification system R (restriction) subunit
MGEILETSVEAYKAHLDEDQQVDFKGKAKSFVRTYDFLASILPYTNAEWEKLSIFLNFLVSKLPAPIEKTDLIESQNGTGKTQKVKDRNASCCGLSV